MGEGESEGQQTQGGDDTQETNDVSRFPQEDCCGATRPMGEGESRKENRLTNKRKAGRTSNRGRGVLRATSLSGYWGQAASRGGKKLSEQLTRE
jgi:hypothetical protein